MLNTNLNKSRPSSRARPTSIGKIVRNNSVQLSSLTSTTRNPLSTIRLHDTNRIGTNEIDGQYKKQMWRQKFNKIITSYQKKSIQLDEQLRNLMQQQKKEELVLKIKQSNINKESHCRKLDKKNNKANNHRIKQMDYLIKQQLISQQLVRNQQNIDPYFCDNYQNQGSQSLQSINLPHFGPNQLKKTRKQSKNKQICITPMVPHVQNRKSIRSKTDINYNQINIIINELHKQIEYQTELRKWKSQITKKNQKQIIKYLSECIQNYPNQINYLISHLKLQVEQLDPLLQADNDISIKCISQNLYKSYIQGQNNWKNLFKKSIISKKSIEQIFERLIQNERRQNDRDINIKLTFKVFVRQLSILGKKNLRDRQVYSLWRNKLCMGEDKKYLDGLSMKQFCSAILLN